MYTLHTIVLRRSCSCRNPEVFEMYKKAVASFWSVEEVDLSQDARDWERLTGLVSVVAVRPLTQGPGYCMF